MTMLPDISEDEYRAWQSDQFAADAQRKIDALAFEHSSNDQLAALRAMAPQGSDSLTNPLGGQAPVPVSQPQAAPPSSDSLTNPLGGGNAEAPSLPPVQPPTRRALEPPAPSPAPLPAPSMPPTGGAGEWFGRALNAVEGAGGDVQRFASTFKQDSANMFGSALDAAEAAGADVQRFATQLGPPPTPSAPPTTGTPAEVSSQPVGVPRGGDLREYARAAAQRNGIDPDIFVRQIDQESGFNPTAKSGAGAQGIAQIVPKFHPGVDTSDPYASLDYAAQLDASHLKTYGSYEKMLAAYNAGGGAVEKYDGVPPFAETQTYVRNIMKGAREGAQGAIAGVRGAVGGAAERLGTTARGAADQISQFGNPQLTNDEAYAACGPAAAVRFASMYGRNPSLREATDLAAQVGWTPGQGMAGLSSEKSLMDKLGVATKMVMGGQWDTFAKEAQSGNPVTISTPGHYYFADGYDPTSGAFHVGRSGTDLKGGSEWMTPQQMEARMGKVQGALLADNPTVPAPSIADQDTNPLGWLDRAKQTIGDSLGGTKDSIAQQLGIATDSLGNVVGAGGLNDRIMQTRPGAPAEAMAEGVRGRLSEVVPKTWEDYTSKIQTPEGSPLVLGGLGKAASAVGTTAKILTDAGNELSPFTAAARVHAGEDYLAWQNPEYRALMQQAGITEDMGTFEQINRAGSMGPAWRDQVQALTLGVRGQGPEVASRAAWDSPRREQLELGYNVLGGAASMGVAPEGLASGVGRFAAATALDPGSLPFSAAMEAGRLAGPISRGLGQAPGAGEAMSLVERGANYVPKTPEFDFEQLARASREAPGGDGLAHLDLHNLPNSPFSSSGGKGTIKTNPGGVPTLDALRDLLDANLHNKDFYVDQADDAERLVGDNKAEWFSLNAITSPLTKVERQLEESINAMGVAREAAANARAAGLDEEQAVVSALRNKDNLSLGSITAANKRNDIEQSYLTGQSIVSGAPKTSSFAGNYTSAGERVYDPRITSDVHNWRLFNVSDETKRVVRKGKELIERPHEKNAANSDSAYRFVEASLNELARERGMDGHQVQSALWSGFRGIQDDAHALSLWKDGRFGEAVALGREKGLFNLPGAGEIEVAMQAPGVQKALARYGHLLKDPPPLQGRGMVREYPGFAASKPAARPERPSTAEFRTAERAVAESGAPLVRGLDSAIVEGLGTTPDGVIPWLGTAHRVEEVSPGEFAVHLPSGNSNTARYVAALIGDATGAESVPIHIPNYRAPDIGGFSVVADPEAISALRAELQTAGIPHVSGTTARSVQIPLHNALDGTTEVGIVQAAQRVGIPLESLKPYAGETTSVVSGSYTPTLSELGPTFGPATAERSDLQQRAVSRLRDLAANRTRDYGADRIGAPDLSGARLSTGGRGIAADLLEEFPGRRQLGNTGGRAVQGAVAGGYEASQQEGATPQSVALGALGGAAVGVARGALPLSSRLVGRAARLVDDTSGLGQVYKPGQGMVDEVPKIVEGELPKGARPIESLPYEETARLRLEDFPADARRLIAEHAKDIDWARMQRRGVIPDAEAQQMAVEYANSTTLDQLIRAGGSGKAYTTEQIRAVRNATAAQAVKLADVTKAITSGADDSSKAVRDWFLEGERLDRLIQIGEGARAETGRAMRAYQDPASLVNLSPADAVTHITRFLGTDKDKLMDAIKSYQQLVDNGSSPVQMANFWSGLKNPVTFLDWFKLLRYNSMLSGPRTLEVNMVGNALEIPWRLGRDTVSSLVRGRPEEIQTEVLGAWGGLEQANRRFMEMLSQGITTDAAARGDLPMSISARLAPSSHIARRAAQGLESTGRFMAATDEWFKAIAYGMSEGRLAARQASKEGLRGDAWSSRVSHIMADKSVVPDLMKQADEMSDRMIFHGDMGATGQGLAYLVNKTGPVGNLILPFLRTTYHITARGIDRSPLGLIGTAIDVGRGQYGKTPAEVRAALSSGTHPGPGVAPLGERLGDNVMGSMIFMGALSQAMQGNVSGAGPDEPQKKALLRAEGWQPYSIRVGNDWVSYANWGPAAMPFSQAAAAAEAVRYGKPGDDVGTLVLDGISRTAQIATEQTYLKSIGTAWKGMTDPEHFGSQWVSDTITSLVPFGSTINTVAQAGDPYARRPDKFDVVGSLRNRLPSGTPVIGGREQVPVVQDVLGRPSPNVRQGLDAINPLLISRDRDDPVLQEFDKVGVAPPAPLVSLTRNGNSIELTPEEQRQIQASAGELIASRVGTEMNAASYRQLNEEGKKRRLNMIVSGARTQVGNKFLSEMPETEFKKRLAEARERRVPVPVSGR